jgi:hypothetical protein
MNAMPLGVTPRPYLNSLSTNNMADVGIFLVILIRLHADGFFKKKYKTFLRHFLCKGKGKVVSVLNS